MLSTYDTTNFYKILNKINIILNCHLKIIIKSKKHEAFTDF